MLKIGTAGWTIPRAAADHFPSEGSGLQRYAARFTAVEINSTFYRSHRSSTYARWVATTPPHFRFAVKAPRTITHVARLAAAEPLIEAFAREAAQLGDKLGPLLMQLPPSLAFSQASAAEFFGALRRHWAGSVVCEPRHRSWFAAAASDLMMEHGIGRVAADPAILTAASVPGGWAGLRYWRLHGSPETYRSPYDEMALQALKSNLLAADGESWCIFDNTASGAAAANALTLLGMMSS